MKKIAAAVFAVMLILSLGAYASSEEPQNKAARLKVGTAMC